MLKFYNDEKVGKGILNRMSDDLVITQEYLPLASKHTYLFTLDEFNISITWSLYTAGKISSLLGRTHKYALRVDGLDLDCSYGLNKLIHTRSNEIFHIESHRLFLQKQEEERMLRKDIKINFGK